MLHKTPFSGRTVKVSTAAPCAVTNLSPSSHAKILKLLRSSGILGDTETYSASRLPEGERNAAGRGMLRCDESGDGNFMSLYPYAKDLLQNASGPHLLELRRSLRSMIPLIVVFIVTLAMTAGLTASFRDEGLLGGAISVRWLAVVPAVILLEIFRRIYDDLYIFREERVLHHDGKLSLTYVVPAVRYSDIRAITVYQNVWGRLLDFGDIAVGTAAQDGAEISFIGVRDPKGLARLLDELRNYHRSKSGEVVRQTAAGVHSSME